MDLHYPLRVLHRDDGMVNFYIYHPMNAWGDYRTHANKNRQLVNWLRVNNPQVPNEVRQMSSYHYDCGGYVVGAWSEPHFCFYSLSKAQYMLVKLTWTFNEIKTQTVVPALEPGTSTNIYIPSNYVQPTNECKVRFEKPGYKPKPLRILD